jgi:hypothetical protein
LAAAGGGAAWTLWAVRRGAPVWQALSGAAVVCVALAGVVCYLFAAGQRDRTAGADDTDRGGRAGGDEPDSIVRAMGTGAHSLATTPPKPSPDAALDDDPAARYCPTCGARLLGNEDHCPYCGTRF